MRGWGGGDKTSARNTYLVINKTVQIRASPGAG